MLPLYHFSPLHLQHFSASNRNLLQVPYNVYLKPQLGRQKLGKLSEKHSFIAHCNINATLRSKEKFNEK